MDTRPIIPTFDELFEPTIKALRTLGSSGSISEIYDKVCELEGYSEEQQSILHKDGPQTEIGYRMGWARTYLKTYGVIESPQRGLWSLTENGRNLKTIDRKKVKQATAKIYKDKNINTPPNNIQIPQPPEDIEPNDGSTPLLDAPIPVDSDLWTQKLLTILQNIPPDAFERLCQHILRASG